MSRWFTDVTSQDDQSTLEFYNFASNRYISFKFYPEVDQVPIFVLLKFHANRSITFIFKKCSKSALASFALNIQISLKFSNFASNCEI